MELFVQSSTIGKTEEEDQAWILACDWEQVEAFLSSPHEWIEEVRKKQGYERTKAIALPPKERAVTFLCHYSPEGVRAQKKRAKVVAEGTRLADVVVVQVVPDEKGSHIKHINEYVAEDSKLQITLRPKDNIGYAHLSLQSKTMPSLVLAALRNPRELVSVLNKMIDGAEVNVIEEGTTNSPKPLVRLAMPSQQALQKLLLVYQLGCPIGAMSCFKVAASLRKRYTLRAKNKRNPSYYYELLCTTWAMTCYYPA